jgi:hypothetical protein
MPSRAALLCALVALALPAWASANGGRYVLVGGTRAERQTVDSALEASSFDWNLVRRQITIEIVRGIDSQSVPGWIWLDADLLDAGAFSWGVVQHEYAHQVDYALLDDGIRTGLLPILGGSAWCYTALALPHADYGRERFASTLAWSYWPSPENCLRPERPGDESSALPAHRFRALLDSWLGRRTQRRAR